MKKITNLVSIAMLTSTAAIAEVRINGFANLVGGITSSGEETLDDYVDKFTFDQESLFAIQVTGDINSKTKATAQIVARGKDDYQPFFEWAYFTFDLSPNSKLSTGRFRIPLFRYSSSLDVGYSYHWIQPPQTIYGVNFNTIEGIRYDYSGFSGDWEYQWQTFAGSYDQEIISPSTGVDIQSDIYDVMGSSIQLQREWLTLRALYARGDNEADLPPINPVLGALDAAGFVTLADRIRLERDEGIFIEVGIDIDFYDWFLGIEYIDTYVENSFIADNIAYYMTGGLRIGAFTPYFTYEYTEGTPKTFADEVDAIPLSVLVPFGPGGAPVPLRIVTSGLLASFAYETEKFNLGLRYDVQPNMSLKFDVIRQDDLLGTGNDATLFRAGVNYVF